MGRRVERLEGEEWVDIDFMSLKEGALFKLFDGGPDPYEDGSRIHRALDNAYLTLDKDNNNLGTIHYAEVLVAE